MASETTYSCDSCGNTLESEKNATPKRGSFCDITQSPNEHIIVNIEVRHYDLNKGRFYGASFQEDRDQDWELCNDCGTKVRKAIKEALR